MFQKTKLGKVDQFFTFFFFKFCLGRRALFSEELSFEPLCTKQTQRYRGRHACTQNIVDVYMSYLRKKVDEGHDEKLIHTVRGIGYTLREPR